jgi:hypothetical protein
LLSPISHLDRLVLQHLLNRLVLQHLLNRLVLQHLLSVRPSIAWMRQWWGLTLVFLLQGVCTTVEQAFKEIAHTNHPLHDTEISPTKKAL